MLQEGLKSFLSANPQIFALVGTRVYASQLPEISAAAPLPAIVYREIHGDGVFSMDGADQLQFSRMQFSCYGKNYADAKRMARMLRLVFEGFTGDLPDGTQIQHIERQSELDLFEDAPFIYCTPIDFQIVYVDSGS